MVIFSLCLICFVLVLEVSCAQSGFERFLACLFDLHGIDVLLDVFSKRLSSLWRVVVVAVLTLHGFQKFLHLVHQSEKTPHL